MQHSRPLLEDIQDTIDAGYRVAHAGRSAEAVDLWMNAYRKLSHLVAALNVADLSAMEQATGRPGYFSRWLSDVELELSNASFNDKHILKTRIDFCRRVVDQFSAPAALVESMRRAIADSYFSLGDEVHADALYQGWLHHDPQWGGGWIGWSDCYWFWARLADDRPKAVSILNRALKVEGLRESRSVRARLTALTKEMNRLESVTDTTAGTY